MTLIEIILVLALLGLMLSSIVPKLNGISRASAKSGVRRFTGLVRYCYDQSILSGRIHRIVLEMNKESQSWAIEMAIGDALPEETIKEDLGIEDTSKSEKEKAELKAARNKGYQAASDSKKHVKPPGIKIVDVKSWRLGEGKSLKEGSISIYCFPNGFIDDATVTLQEAGRSSSPLYSIKTRSLTGRVDIEVESPKP